MFRIYCDANARDELARYDLAIPGSLKDIAPIADKLGVGMHVILYEDDYEVEAVLDFDSKGQSWVASPIWRTMKRYE